MRLHYIPTEDYPGHYNPDRTRVKFHSVNKALMTCSYRQRHVAWKTFQLHLCLNSFGCCPLVWRWVGLLSYDGQMQISVHNASSRLNVRIMCQRPLLCSSEDRSSNRSPYDLFVIFPTYLVALCCAVPILSGNSSLPRLQRTPVKFWFSSYAIFRNFFIHEFDRLINKDRQLHETKGSF